MKSKIRHSLSATAVSLIAFLLYAFTGARTIQWQDSAQFTYRVTSGTLWNEYGLAMVHPLHFWIGRLMLGLFPGPDPWAVSLTSALGGGVAVGLVFVCILKLTGKTSAAGFGAATLMLAHSFWRFSGLPEVYTWSAALLLGEVFFYLRVRSSDQGAAWWGVFFVNGLALANHNMALLSTAVWGITFLLWASERSRESGDGGRGSALEWKRLKSFWQLIPIGFFWLLGALPYLLIVLLELKARPFGEVIHSALFGEGFKDQVTGLLPRPGFLLISLGFMLLSFPGMALPLAGVAAVKRIRIKATGLIPLPVLLITALHLLFFLRYNVIDQYTFLIPVYALIALLAGVGFASLNRACWRRAAWGLLLLQPFFYAVVPSLARQGGVLAKYDRHKPYRDDYSYLFFPWQLQERSADRLMQEAFAAVGKEGLLVVEDSMAMYTALWSRMHLGLEDQIKIVHPAELFGESVPDGAVWVPARSDIPPLPGWRKVGEIWVRGEKVRGQ